MTDAAEKIKVVVAMDFSDKIMDQLRRISPKYEIVRCFPEVSDAAWSDAEVLYTLRTLPDPVQVPRLRWIQFHSAGLDKVIDHPIVQAEDVEVTSASGIHATHMAEYCLGMMLAFAYKLPDMERYKTKTQWPENQYQIFRPVGLRGTTLGIVGYGSIGRELARMAAALGMIVLATKRDVMHPEDETGYVVEGTGDPEGEIPERLYPADALASMAKDCDYLVVTAPLTASTRHSVNEDVFSAMKKTAFLVNVGRGGVVDEAALISALAAETIAGAALDVFEEEPLPATSPLWNLDNVIISPHVSGNHVQYHENVAALFAENLRRYVEKRPLLNILDRSRGY
jgi:phosphoglycerate dehydrogenase-like enzyme